MLFTVVAPYYNNPKEIKLFLSCLNQIDYMRDQFEVIIVNNCDAPLEIKSTINFTLRVIDETRPGSYSARNKAILEARGDILAFTDIDCLPRSDWLKQADNFFKHDKKVERLMGEIYLYPSFSIFSLGWIVDSATAFIQKQNFKNGLSPTANLFVKKEVFDGVGFFDGSLYSGGDFEWSERAKKAGVRLSFSENIVVLHPSRSLHQIYAKSKRVIGGLFTLYSRNGKLLELVIRRTLPPIKSAYTAFAAGRPLYKVLIAIPVIWAINLFLLIEILRLYRGGKPQRK